MNNYYQKYISGHSIDAYKFFGAHLAKDGVIFRLYAPNAKSVRVVGEFNDWNSQSHFMERINDYFELKIKNAKINHLYKYAIEDQNQNIVYKSDPFAFRNQYQPGHASIVSEINFEKLFADKQWMKNRNNAFDEKMNIYELYLASFKKKEDGTNYNYVEIANLLVEYLKKHNFTHVELMPINEHPFDGSWGYQISNYFAITTRYGSNRDFASFVNILHQNGIGVIIDFVPVHFVKDQFSLANFDGSRLYEYQQDYDALSEWGTLNFDLNREHVRSFLMSAMSMLFDVYHVDGIRMDAIKNAIYWQGNKDRGVNNGAIDFLKRCNFLLHEAYPGIMMIAEDSSDYPFVCASTLDGGLAFDYKWNMGWMNDSLEYFEKNPIYRGAMHHNLTFAMAYFHSERFILALSHDEVVHSKKTIIDKMWGNYEQKFAQAKSLYTLMYTHPGKKLNFMGNELAHFREFSEKQEMDWFLLKYPSHDSFNRYFRELTKIYSKYDALYHDFYPNNFRWIDADNSFQNLYSYQRFGTNYTIVVIINLSNVDYYGQRIGIEFAGTYRLLLNSDDEIYGGTTKVEDKVYKSEKIECNNYKNSIMVDIKALSSLVLVKRKKLKGE